MPDQYGRPTLQDWAAVTGQFNNISDRRLRAEEIAKQDEQNAYVRSNMEEEKRIATDAARGTVDAYNKMNGGGAAGPSLSQAIKSPGVGGPSAQPVQGQTAPQTTAEPAMDPRAQAQVIENTLNMQRTKQLAESGEMQMQVARMQLSEAKINRGLGTAKALLKAGKRDEATKVLLQLNDHISNGFGIERVDGDVVMLRKPDGSLTEVLNDMQPEQMIELTSNLLVDQKEFINRQMANEEYRTQLNMRSAASPTQFKGKNGEMLTSVVNVGADGRSRVVTFNAKGEPVAPESLVTGYELSKQIQGNVLKKYPDLSPSAQQAIKDAHGVILKTRTGNGVDDQEAEEMMQAAAQFVAANPDATMGQAVAAASQPVIQRNREANKLGVGLTGGVVTEKQKKAIATAAEKANAHTQRIIDKKFGSSDSLSPISPYYSVISEVAGSMNAAIAKTGRGEMFGTDVGNQTLSAINAILPDAEAAYTAAVQQHGQDKVGDKTQFVGQYVRRAAQASIDDMIAQYGGGEKAQAPAPGAGALGSEFSVLNAMKNAPDGTRIAVEDKINGGPEIMVTVRGGKFFDDAGKEVEIGGQQPAAAAPPSAPAPVNAPATPIDTSGAPGSRGMGYPDPNARPMTAQQRDARAARNSLSQLMNWGGLAAERKKRGQ